MTLYDGLYPNYCVEYRNILYISGYNRHIFFTRLSLTNISKML